MGITSPRAGATKCGWRACPTWRVARGRGLPARWLLDLGALPHHCDALEVRTPDRRDPVKDVTGWPANPNLVRHLKSTLIWTGVHVDEAVMGLSVHTDEDGGGDNPLLGTQVTSVLLFSETRRCEVNFSSQLSSS